MTDGTEQGSFQDLYKLSCKVGRGGFGDVYTAIRKDTNKEYAAKIIRSDVTNRDDVKHEIKICKKLDNRNVVKLVEFFLQPKYCTLVFDMVWGGELFDDIAERELYTEQDACQCIEQILQGVAYLHRNEIIHRDLKPENILLTKTDQDAVVKIADFGSAVETKGRKRYEYGRAGTVYYMAPEVDKLKPYGTAVDLWPCGALLYIMLVGESPTCGENESLYSQVELGLLKFPDGSDAVCDEAKDLIGQLLTLDQDQRVAAEDALMHPFIRKRTTVTTRFHRRNTIDEMKKFVANTRDIREQLSQDVASISMVMKSFSIEEDVRADSTPREDAVNQSGREMKMASATQVKDDEATAATSQAPSLPVGSVEEETGKESGLAKTTAQNVDSFDEKSFES